MSPQVHFTPRFNYSNVSQINYYCHPISILAMRDKTAVFARQNSRFLERDKIFDSEYRKLG